MIISNFLNEQNINSQQMFKKIFLDESFVKCFAPIHIVQWLLGSSRTNIKNNSVKSITLEQKLFSFIWILCFTVSFLYLQIHYFQEFYHKNTVLYVASLIGSFVQYISYLCNIINVRFLDNTSSKEVYNLIQKIDDILLLKQYKNLKHSQYYWNVVLMMLIVLPFECSFMYYMLLTVEYPALTVFLSAGLSITYIDLLLTGSLIYYVTIRLKYLNKIVRYNISIKYPGFSKEAPPEVNQDLIISPDAADGTQNLNLDKFLISLKQILRSYNKITEAFCLTVFNVVASCFIWTLVIIEAIVAGLRDQALSQIAVIYTSLSVIYYFILLSSLALVNNIFIQEVRQTKLLCIHVMSYHYEGPIRQGGNDILREIEFMHPEFSVYGIFVLDKSLVFKLIGMITTNIVVIIQFTI